MGEPKILASIPYTIEGDEGVDIECTIEVTAWGFYDPGVRFGPVENCYPPEGEAHEYYLLDNNGNEVAQIDDDLMQSIIDDYLQP